MSKQGLMAVMLVAGSLVLAACAKEEGAAAPGAGASVAAAAPAAAAAGTAEPAQAAPTASVDALGVEECDDFLTKYEACVNDKVPAGSRDAFRQSIAATRAGWKQAIDAGGRDQLAAACTQMKETSKTSLQAYGCSF